MTAPPQTAFGLTPATFKPQRTRTGLCPRMAVPNRTTAWPLVLQRHFGTWKGNYVHVDGKTGEVLDRHTSTLTVGARGERYAQRNTYDWPDGRQEVYDFPGYLSDDGILLVENERIKARYNFLDDDTIIFYGAYKNGSVDLWDLTRLLSDTKRARTWQVCKDQAVLKLVHIEEEKVSTDDAYIEM